MLTTRMLTAALSALLCFAPAAAADRLPPGQARLGQVLAGRLEGEPVNCLTLHRVRSSWMIEGTAVIFETPSIIYVNRPVSGAEFLSNSKALLLTMQSSEICRGEAVSLFDTSSRAESGLVFLGKFVPYRKADRR